MTHLSRTVLLFAQFSLHEVLWMGMLVGIHWIDTLQKFYCSFSKEVSSELCCLAEHSLVFLLFVEFASIFHIRSNKISCHRNFSRNFSVKKLFVLFTFPSFFHFYWSPNGDTWYLIENIFIGLHQWVILINFPQI